MIRKRKKVKKKYKIEYFPLNFNELFFARILKLALIDFPVIYPIYYSVTLSIDAV